MYCSTDLFVVRALLKLCRCKQVQTQIFDFSGLMYLITVHKDYRGIYRLSSYMNEDEGSEANHCCQVCANFSASVTKFFRHIF